jgi:NAD(P)-dependent dehydrogenase (short-subunit alcohol dehydrogenase family)
VALITGGGGGIGRAIAHTLAHHGATVVVADINVKSAAETVRYIENNGGLLSLLGWMLPARKMLKK